MVGSAAKNDADGIGAAARLIAPRALACAGKSLSEATPDGFGAADQNVLAPETASRILSAIWLAACGRSQRARAVCIVSRTVSFCAISSNALASTSGLDRFCSINCAAPEVA